MKLSAGQAAEATGKSIPTITRAIKKGLITAEKTTSGGYLIDPAELFRVFEALPSDPNPASQPLDSETLNKTSQLEAELKLLREMLSRADDTISDLRNDRDRWRDQADRATLLLTDQSQKPQQRGWWPFKSAA